MSSILKAAHCKHKYGERLLLKAQKTSGVHRQKQQQNNNKQQQQQQQPKYQQR
jgi:hypothetical protein